MSREKSSCPCAATACPPTMAAMPAFEFLLATSAPNTIAASIHGACFDCCVSSREICRCVTWLSSCASTAAI